MKNLLKHADSEIDRLCNFFPDINDIYDMPTNLNPKSVLEVVLNENENELAKIEEMEICRAFDSFKHLNIINFEKLSRAYSKLIKNSNKKESITNIKNQNGECFSSDKDREDFIVDHFSKKFNNSFSPSINIDKFFGEFCDNPILNSFKLSEQKKINFDREISLNDIDLALKNSNKNSLAGKFIYSYLI